MQRKLYRIEIHLLEAAGVARSCEVPVLGIEIALNIELCGNPARVFHFDAEHANLVPAGDVAPSVEPVVFGLEIHQPGLDDDIRYGPEVKLDVFIHRDILERRLTGIGQVSGVADTPVDLQHPAGDGCFAQFMLGVILEAKKADHRVALPLLLVFV
jgi:hypothetical protein